MQRHEIYAQGAKPGDAPIEVSEEAIPQEELRLNAVYKRLLAFDPKVITDPNVRQVITDLLSVLDLENDGSEAHPSTISDIITTSFYERIKRVFHAG